MAGQCVRHVVGMEAFSGFGLPAQRKSCYAPFAISNGARCVKCLESRCVEPRWSLIATPYAHDEPRHGFHRAATLV